MNIAENLGHVKHCIAQACKAANRDPAAVKLLAVSKRHPASAVREAYAAGQRDFGENYVAEALAKQRELSVLPLHWQLIGPLQSNKARDAANAFDQIESIDRAKLVDVLARWREPARGPLKVLIQVNIDGEASKSGCAPSEVTALAALIAATPLLQLRGLMSIPAPDRDPLAAHQRMASLYAALREEGHALDCLSLGMSDDLIAAIAAGSTQVRVGTAIFGARLASS